MKPENILVNKLKKQMKILQIGDFGISKKTTIPQTTFTNAFSTTISYKAPEAMKGEAPTTKADIFALGIIFYELLTLKYPFVRMNLE